MILNAFGVTFDLQVDLPELETGSEPIVASPPEVVVRYGSREEVEESFSGRQHARREASAQIEGTRWTVEHGVDGDLRMSHTLASFHFDPAGGILTCAPATREDPRWLRLLLDTGLVTASLALGREALHAGAVVIDDRCVAIVGPSGAGKTSLAVELIRAGGMLLTDDVLTLSSIAGRVLAHPGPPLVNAPTRTEPLRQGRVVARFEGEAWTHVPTWAHPIVPSVVVLLGRGPEVSHLTVSARPDRARDLLFHMLHSGADHQRRRARFDTAADLGTTVALVSLEAPLSATPAQLALILRTRLGALAG